MHIGYCRVSTGKQAASIEAQEAQLRKAGCEIVYKDENESGGKRNRPQLNKALEHIRKGDVLVVCKLDRLSRSMIDLLTILKQIVKQAQRSAAWVKRSKLSPLPVV